MAKQSISDGRNPGFSYITHVTMQALHSYFDQVKEGKLSTGIALYVGIAYLVSAEEKAGRHERGIERTREEIGAAGGVSATNVTRYSQHLVAAEVLELEQLVAGGANVYRWTLVEPPFHAPLQIGEAVGAHPQGGDTPHHPGEASNQGGDTPHQGGEATNNSKKTDKKKTPVVPCGDDLLDSQILEIFEFWKEITGRNGSTVLTPNRRRAIRARLGEPERNLNELKLAIANVGASDWHMKRGRFAGREGQVQSDLTLICRNGEKLEGYRDMGSKDSVAVQLRASLDQVEAEPVEPSERSKQAWVGARQHLSESVPETAYRKWLAPFVSIGERRGRLVLADQAADDMPRCEWVQSKYAGLIREALDGTGFTDVEMLDEIPPGLEPQE